jgi:hypothetical protein
MRFDNIVEEIKKGDMSEKEGLDSLKKFSISMNGFLQKSDSLLKASTDRYWRFRKSFEEYQYNMYNLRILYSGKKDK